MKIRCFTATLTLCAVAGPTTAHNPLPGIEGFYSGLFHPFTTPDQIVTLLALGLALGSYAMRRLGGAFAALCAGLVSGLAIGSPLGSAAPWLFGLAAIAATFAALAPGRSLPVLIALSFIAGGLIGWASLPNAGPMRDRLFTMSGSVFGAALGILYIAGAVDLACERINAPWFTIVLRVIAAWIGAIALLMLALLFGPSP